MAGNEAGLGLVRRLRELSLGLFRHFTPPQYGDQPENLRRARLIIGFAILGGLFGLSFATFYALIGHVWGGGIILVCCTAFSVIPYLLRRTGSADRAGNLYCLILIIGFFCLCWVEGGMHGHALAWLVTVPLCALLLTSRRAAFGWGAGALVAAVIVVAAEFVGYSPPFLYPEPWHNIVCAAGYVSLVAFMFILGLIFETGRCTAQARMQRTLGELAEANQHLTQLNQEKNEFLGIAAHDLRNPLIVVMGYSEMLDTESPGNERTSRFAKAINREATRMRDLINNLLDLNAIEDGRTNLKVQPVDLAALTTRAVENLQTVSRKKDIRITTFQPANLSALADSNALLQILDNLISNAVKFSRPGTEVKVFGSTIDGRAMIQVVDQGPGITADDRKKLFKRFSKLSARPTGGESSNGLGLSIVKRLVEAMNGTITCASEAGKGTTFIVSLPAAPAERTSPPRPQVKPVLANPPSLVEVA